MTVALLIELRRSPLRWWLPFLVAVDLAVLFGRSTAWIGVWPQASAAAQVPAFFVGPILAAGTAWAAGRGSRAGLPGGGPLIARPRWQVELVQVTSAALYGMLTLVISAVVAAAASVRQAGPGFLWPGYLLLAAGTLTLCVAFGHLLGSWSRSRFGPPIIAGLGAFTVFAWTPPGADYPLFLLSGPPQLRFAAAALAARLLLVAVVVFAAVAVTPQALRDGRLRVGRRYAPLLAAGVGAVLALGAAAAAGPLRVEREPPLAAMCSQTTPRVCVWPEQRKYLPALSAMAERLERLPPGLVSVPGSFYERGLRGADQSGSDFLIVEGEWSAVPALSIAIVDRTLPPPCPLTEPDAEVKYGAIFELVEWLNRRAYGGEPPPGVQGGPPGVDLLAVREVLTRPDAEQAEWVRQRLRIIEATPCA